MSNGLKYTKKFIIFKKDYGNLKDLKTKGHGKFELRGNNLNFSLDIKGAEANNFYNIDLIKGRENYTLAKIFTKEDRSGKRDIDINYRELEKSGFSLDKIDGIILERDGSVLFGESLKENDRSLKLYIEEIEKSQKPIEPLEIEENDWEEQDIKIEYLENEIETTPEEMEALEETLEEIIIVDEAVDEVVDEEVIIEEVVEEVVDEIVVEEVGEVVDEVVDEIIVEEVVVEEVAEEEAVVEEEAVETDNTISQEDMYSERTYEEIMEEMFNIPELGYENNNSSEELEKEEENKTNSQTEQVTDYVLNVLNFFPYSEPFTRTLDGYNWWQININEPDNDRSFLPYFSYVIGGDNKASRFEEKVNPKDLLRKYEHYLFGLYNEGDKVKFYMYGVPGRFALEDYPKGGNTGFNTWFEGKEVPGYWILYIEPETGRILYPINPMIPKE